MLKGYVETDRCPYLNCGGTPRKAFAQHNDYTSTDGRNAVLHVAVPEHGLCVEMYMEILKDGEPVACRAGIYSIGFGLLTISTTTAKNRFKDLGDKAAFMDFFRTVRALGHMPYKMSIVAPGVVERIISPDNL